jgi:type VI protein secretion system component VasF
MTDSPCLQCGSPDVHRSRRRQVFERLLVLIGGRMQRCHDCKERFLKLGGSLIRMKDLRRLRLRLAIAAGMVIALLLLLVAIIWFSHSLAASSPETALLLLP